jgi:hypothetical protein
VSPYRVPPPEGARFWLLLVHYGSEYGWREMLTTRRAWWAWVRAWVFVRIDFSRYPGWRMAEVVSVTQDQMPNIRRQIRDGERTIVV